jgi:hypothetical protein
MKNRLVLLGLVFSLATTILISSCTKEPERQTWPLSVEIFHSVDGKQVAFTALTHSATSWLWEFGDGNSSSEQNPVYEYPEGGYFIATLTAKDNSGTSVTSEVKLAIDLPPRSLLVGDHTVDGYNGKTWKLTASHTSADKLANADAGFSIAAGAPETLPQGAFDLYLSMGEVYDDTYTFFNDGSYSHDVKDDGAAFSGLLYQMVVSGGTGSTIVNMGGQDFGLCTGVYTPEDDATFEFVENENFAVSSVYGEGGVLTFPGVMTIDFPNSTEFIGLMDFQRKVIVQELTESSMRLVMFLALSPDAFGVNTHALVLTFEVVN